MRAKVWVLVLFCALALVAPAAWATTARALSNQDLANAADVVVIGKCLSVRTAWIDRTLVRIATVQVTENLRGGGSTVNVVLPGGADANRKFPVAMVYAGAPQMAAGEEVFLFLADEPAVAGGYAVLGFSQGKFNIVDVQGEKVVGRDLSQINLQTSTGIARGTRTTTRLSEFKAEVQKYLRNR